MCGIAGEFNFLKSVKQSDVKRMTDAIVHRGPDDEGFYCEGGIGLGHRRLSIIGLSESGRNPIWSTDKTMLIVFNGEVYNYLEIKTLLLKKGYEFYSETDTEVVLNAIHCWGIENAVKLFIGMFAFAIWDTRDQSLLLVRDRVGVKPLFYFKDQSLLLFGSELRTLYAHPHYKKKLSQRGLGQYFSLGYTLDKTTVLEDTYRLPAGHFLKIKADGVLNLHKYWCIEDTERGTYKGTFDDAVEDLEKLTESAFSYRLVSDVPVGVFLSGGIDSTFLSAILKKRIKADLLHITIGFSDPRYDETHSATKIAAELGIRHEVRYFDAPDAEKSLRQFSEIYDEPFGDSSGMPTALLSSVAREKVKVVLSADGGDEMFCGYESYPDYANSYKQVSKLPLVFRLAGAQALSALPYEKLISSSLGKIGSRTNPRLISTFEKVLEIMRAGNSADIIFLMNQKGWSKQKVAALLGNNISDVFSDTIFASRLTGNDVKDSTELMDKMMRADYQSFLRDDILTKVDRASMAASLECRDPFLDHRIAEFACSLPLEYMYKNGEHKYILKQILRRWISEPILQSPKRGFVVPLYEWMKGPFKPLVLEYLSKERVLSIGALDDKIVSAEVDRFYRYNGVGAEKLLLLLNFQMWAYRWYKV
jgi:asparagine synthase (glutamine-hydrolysing)